MRHPRSDSEATSNRVPSEESVPLYLKRVFFGTILPAKASVPFICAIRKIRGSISLRSEQPLAVTQAVWSAAGGRACTGCLSSGNAETHFVKKRVRCSRGCLPASGGLPRIVRKSFRLESPSCGQKRNEIHPRQQPRLHQHRGDLLHVPGSDLCAFCVQSPGQRRCGFSAWRPPPPRTSKLTSPRSPRPRGARGLDGSRP